MPTDENATTDPLPVPDPIGFLASVAPEFHTGYIASRDQVMRHNPTGMTDREKELVLVAIDTIRGNAEAGTFHALAAMRHGAPLTAVLDTLLLCLLVGGAATWGITGMHIYLASQQWDESRRAQGQ